MNPAGESLPGHALAEKLGAALGRAPGTGMPAAAFNAMARAIARMSGMEFKLLGEGGLPLAPAGSDNQGADNQNSSAQAGV